MTDVEFKVSQAGRRRVLETQSKNVHAFVCGTVESLDETWEHIPFTHAGIVTYNPYKHDSFVRRDCLSPVFTAKKVMVSGRDVFILEN